MILVRKEQVERTTTKIILVMDLIEYTGALLVQVHKSEG